MDAGATCLGGFLPDKFNCARRIDAGSRAAAAEHRSETTCQSCMTARCDGFVFFVAGFTQFGAQVDEAGCNDVASCVETFTGSRNFLVRGVKCCNMTIDDQQVC